MRNTFKISLSVIRRNRGFSIGLIIMLAIMTTVMLVVTALPCSLRDTINRYITEYNMPQAWITTEPAYTASVEEIENIQGIKAAEACMVFDGSIKTENEKLFSMRFFSMDEKSFRRFYKKEAQENCDEMGIYLTAYFACANGLHAGDSVNLKTPSGFKETVIQAVVSLPEGMNCARDETSWYEDAGFGYVFLDREYMDELFAVNGISNQWVLLFDEGLNVEGKEQAVQNVCKAIESNVMSYTLYEGSQLQNHMEELLNILENTCSMLPVCILAAGFCFAYLFIGQVIRNQRKTIGMLRAIGYTKKQVLVIFSVYIILIFVAALVIGLILGSCAVHMLLKLYVDVWSLPYISYHVKPVLLTVMIAALPIICLFACMINAGEITGIDPSEAYGGANQSGKAVLPHFVEKLNINVFTKISIAALFRNRKRLILSALSLAACMTLTILAIECTISKREGKVRSFDERLRYDCIVGTAGGDAAIEEIRGLSSVEIAEPISMFTANLEKEGKSIHVQINAITEDSELIVPSDASYVRTWPEDGIVLEEYVAEQLGVRQGDTVCLEGKVLTVKKISREAVNSIQYISPETAKKLGYAQPNGVAVRFYDGADLNLAYNEISDTIGYNYTTVLSVQKQGFKEMMRSLDVVYYTFILLAMFLGFLIVFNMVAIGVGERKREYATLLALGTKTGQFISAALLENAIRFAAAIIPACLIGWAISAAVLKGMSSIQQNYPFVYMGYAMLIGCGISVLYIVAGVWVTIKKIKSIDPAILLNVRE